MEGAFISRHPSYLMTWLQVQILPEALETPTRSKQMRSRTARNIVAAMRAGRISDDVARDLLDKEENEERLREWAARGGFIGAWCRIAKTIYHHLRRRQ